ncbi:MAG: SDR family NAD(P)-dependent oxidoreductase [Halanaerobiales bacterium]|nr:SDR family NAD(P)-dependent oxidoreductase [Halanaerobiales bacterium]
MKERLSLDKFTFKEIEESDLLSIEEISNKDVAIIGVGAILPDSKKLEEFWKILKEGKNCLSEFPENRKKNVADYLCRSLGKNEDEIGYIKGAYLNEVDKFDYKFFRFTPKEASLMNPNQRIFLETVWSAIEDAGYGGKKLSTSSTGVYVGYISDLEGYKYKEMIKEYEPPATLSIGTTGNLSSIIPARISYLLDLKGPSLLVDTACSSSLVALHLACQAVKNGDCDQAIVGGIRLNLFPLEDNVTIGIEAADGLAKTFDNRADGTGMGEGSIALLIKPLRSALRDRENIYAVIKGSAVNQDGNSVGISAPNPAAQTQVISKAWKNSEVEPETISYIEAHGTGTKLGDPIEIEGIKKAFSGYTDKKQFCAIGSVKTNIGHLYEAAGLASVLKVILAMKHKEIPPTLHFQKPNSRINFEDSPVYVNDHGTRWVSESPLRSGISAFGFSGTNCHVIIEEAPKIQKKNRAHPIQVFTLSAMNQNVLSEMISNYIVHLKVEPELDLEDICYTVNTGRGHYHSRLAIIVEDKSDLLEKLSILKNEIREDLVRSIYFKESKNFLSESDNEAVRELTLKASLLLEEFVGSRKNDDLLLTDICKLYVEGAEVDWEILYVQEDVYKVSLPTYPFERIRCWPNIPEYRPKDKKMYYHLEWQKCKKGEERVIHPIGTVLILSDEKMVGDDLANRVQSEGMKAIIGYSGDEYKKIDFNKYTVRKDEEGFKILFENLKTENITDIVYLSSRSSNDIQTIDQLVKSQEVGVLGILNCAKAIMSGENRKEVRLLIIGENVYQVTGEETVLNPQHAPMFGLGKVISEEYPLIKCKAIDVDLINYNEIIIDELKFEFDTYLNSYRQSERFVQVFKEMDVEAYSPANIFIQKDGVYIITGGTGGIGREIAKYLAAKNKIKLILVNRSKMVERELWDQIIAEDKDQKLIQKFTELKKLESTGSEVIYYSADISNYDEVKKLVDNVNEKYGKINGIIHSAGLPGKSLLVQKDQNSFEKVLAPKIYGAWALDRATRNQNLDFFVLFSSGLSFFPLPGQGDYTAANAYLDAFPDFRNKYKSKTMTINWVAWNEIGMAVDQGFTNDLLFKSLSTKDAVKAFDYVLHKAIPSVLIGELNKETNIVQYINKLPFYFDDHLFEHIQSDQKIPENNVGEVILKGKEFDSYTVIEMQIAQICKEILGFDEIDIYENFFDLGIDSILLSKLHSQVEVYYPGRISLTELFKYSTIFKLAEFLSSENTPVDEEKTNLDEELGKLFQDFENGDLTIDDAILNLELL